ncbi:hypothetical protein C2G38_2171768 [Gigaspora rosea]|uniref:Uncharacterized protein n=1 Tax=Gigaspora rosea TaxID=44941 RepID=A0A397VQJ0_9GLOM|nr:hypothetical protein C2G38_2171768 [Gigaspora rosea]
MDENFCVPLNDEQIPTVLVFLMKTMVDIITRDVEFEDLMQREEYSSIDDERSAGYNYRGEVRKVRCGTFECYQKLVRMEYAKEADDTCNADCYNEVISGSRKNKKGSLRTRRKSNKDLYESKTVKLKKLAETDDTNYGICGFKYNDKGEGMEKSRYKTNFDSSESPEFNNRKTWDLNQGRKEARKGTYLASEYGMTQGRKNRSMECTCKT